MQGAEGQAATRTCLSLRVAIICGALKGAADAVRCAVRLERCIRLLAGGGRETRGAKSLGLLDHHNWSGAERFDLAARPSDRQMVMIFCWLRIIVELMPGATRPPTLSESQKQPVKGTPGLQP